MLTKQETLLEGAPGREQQGEEPREDCSTCGLWSHVYGEGIRFWVVSGQLFWLRVLPGGITQTSWIPERRILGGCMDWHLLSPFDPSWVLPIDGDSLVPCSLPGSPVVKQLVWMVTVVPGQGEWSVGVSPENIMVIKMAEAFAQPGKLRGFGLRT